MRKIYSLHHTLAMTLHRELEVGEAAISNNNGFKQGTVFDHEGEQRAVTDGTAEGIHIGLRMAETLVLHDELFQLHQTLHCHRKSVRKGIGRNVNGLKIGVVCERQFSHINLPAMGWANESLDGRSNHLGVEGLQTTQIAMEIQFGDVFRPPWSIYS